MNPSVTPIKTKWHNPDEFLNCANVSDVFAFVAVVLNKLLNLDCETSPRTGNDRARPLYSKAYRTTALPHSL